MSLDFSQVPPDVYLDYLEEHGHDVEAMRLWVEGGCFVVTARDTIVPRDSRRECPGDHWHGVSRVGDGSYKAGAMFATEGYGWGMWLNE